MESSAPPLFLLGAPRSGTTALYRALVLHPDAAWINNYVRRMPGLPQLSGLNRLVASMPKVRKKVWFGDQGDRAYRYNERRTIIDRLFPQPVEGEPVFEHRGVREGATDDTPADSQLRLRHDFSQITRWSGGKVLVSKRIGHNRRVPLLHGLFPDGRFAVLTRDGRAVALSLSRVDWWHDQDIWWYGGTPETWAAEGRDPLELCARHWVEEVQAIDAGLSEVPDNQVLRLRYEDLIDSPIHTLNQLAEFAGLTPSRAWTQALADVHFPDQNQGWRTELADRETMLMATQGDMLKTCGYVS